MTLKSEKLLLLERYKANNMATTDEILVVTTYILFIFVLCREISFYAFIRLRNWVDRDFEENLESDQISRNHNHYRIVSTNTI